MSTPAPQWETSSQSMQRMFLQREMGHGTPVQEAPAELPRFAGVPNQHGKPMKGQAFNRAQMAGQMAATGGVMPMPNMLNMANMRPNGYEGNPPPNMAYHPLAPQAGSPMHAMSPHGQSIPPQTPLSMSGASPPPSGSAASPPKVMPGYHPAFQQGHPQFPPQHPQHQQMQQVHQMPQQHQGLPPPQYYPQAQPQRHASQSNVPHPPTQANGTPQGMPPQPPGPSVPQPPPQHQPPVPQGPQKAPAGLSFAPSLAPIIAAQMKMFHFLTTGRRHEITQDLANAIRMPPEPTVPIGGGSMNKDGSSAPVDPRSKEPEVVRQPSVEEPVSPEKEPLKSTLGKRKEAPSSDPEDEAANDELSPAAKRARTGTADSDPQAEAESSKATVVGDSRPPTATEPPVVEEAPVQVPKKEPSPVQVIPPTVETQVAVVVPAPPPAPVPIVHPPPPYMMEEDPSNPMFPYNAYVSPYTLVASASRNNTRQHVPCLLPDGLGLDAYAMKRERDRFIERRQDQRVRELEGGARARPQKLHDTYLQTIKGRAGLKMKALIELKALQLREKQRKLRQDLVFVSAHATALPTTSVFDRDAFRRPKKTNLHDVRVLEKNERRQRHSRDKGAHAQHKAELDAICAHGKEMIVSAGVAKAKTQRFGARVLKFHQEAEKEEQKRMERISRERLKALKNDDEETYMRLIDTAKDTRITHLLRQTDSYLDNLAMAVVAQQNDDVHREAMDAEDAEREDAEMEMEEGPANEATFGAVRQDDPADDQGKVDYYAVAHRISEKVHKQPDLLVGGTLKDYQVKGLQWMVSLYNNRLNGILADEMGLGKTIQTISLVAFLIEKKRQPGPYLVIVPLSTLTNWAIEFEKWAPSVSTLIYKGTPQKRRDLSAQIKQLNFQVLLTTYEYIIKDRSLLSKIKWTHMIIDEGHRLKNAQSKLSQTLSQYYVSRYRLILTGTPLQNNLPELWALLNFVLPKIFNSVKSFDEWFNMPFANTGTQDKIELNEEEQLLIIRRLHKVLRPFLLRRLKKDVESELPDKVEKVIKCKMSALQMKLYGQMKTDGMLYTEKVDAKGRPVGMKGLSNVVMQLRKICCHPYVFPEVEKVINPGRGTDANIYRVAGKFELLDRVLPKLLKTGHRMLIFFQMTSIMDIFEDFMRYKAYQYLRLDGSTKPEERSAMLQKFNAPDSPIDLFLLSTRAGGLGLNLQTADTVIIFDSDWNPHADLQAQDRAHRIGQKKAVCILRLITQNSFEEEILDRARGKLDIDGKVIQAGRFDNKSTNEEREQFLRSMLEQDHEQTEEEEGEMNDEEINEILARGDDELEIFRRMDVERDRDADREWRAGGGRGPRPDRLMQESELPESYLRERVPTLLEDDNLMEGRGARVRGPVRYTDGLTDEQFGEILEDEGADLNDEIEKKQRRRDKRAANKVAREAAQNRSITNTPAPDVELPAKPKKGKGRPPKKQVQEWQESPAAAAGSKRKRGGTKEVSITPSYDDDEEDKPDNKRRKLPSAVPANIRERMRAVFSECYQSVATCVTEDGRRRCDLFREPPNRRQYPDYYAMIPKVIAMSTIRKRMQSTYYKTMLDFRADWQLMFDNARKYNQEGSMVYIDADEMQRAFEETYDRLTIGTDLPGAEPGDRHPYAHAGSSQMMEDDDEQDVRLPARSKSGSRRPPNRAPSSDFVDESDLSEE